MISLARVGENEGQKCLDLIQKPERVDKISSVAYNIVSNTTNKGEPTTMWMNEAQRTIAAPAQQIFAIWCNFAERPSWDEHDEWVHLQGPLAIGTTIHLKTQGAPPAKVHITEFEPGRRIVTEGIVPFGKLRFVFELQVVDSSLVHVSYSQEIRGPLTPLLARIFGPRMATDAPITLDRLAQRVSLSHESI